MGHSDRYIQDFPCFFGGGMNGYDRCRISSCHSPRNLALLRRMALNALNQEKRLKRSLRQKMKRAAMNNDYMMTVLQSFCQ